MSGGECGNIVVMGGCNYDVFLHVSRFPNPGETIVATNYTTDTGGKGANQAVCCAILGAPVTFIGCVGDDSYGREITESLKKHGVVTTYLKVDSTVPTAVGNITVNTTTGENQIIVNPGANYALMPDSWSFDYTKFSSDKPLIFVCGNEMLPETTIWALKSLKNAHQRMPNTVTVFNGSPSDSTAERILNCDCVNVLVVNQHELYVLSSLNSDRLEELDETSLEAQCHELFSRYHNLELIVATLGHRGAFLKFNPQQKGGRPWQEMNLKKSGNIVAGVQLGEGEVKDTTGAGDCFLASFCVGLLKYKFDVLQAAKLANKNAADSVKYLGTQKSYAQLPKVM